MDNIYEELKNIFQNFRWIDNIPEDQYRRDEICSTSATFGEENPQPPLSRQSLVRRRIAAACNARRNSYGVIAIFERQFQNSSKILENHRCDLKAERFRWLFIQ